ncbi:MAG: GNAT family N-acetyltransferase [Chloroflexi bacterium]|nr:GNAT family N-acetyltransferase [Chloroflexota bacterium]
MVNRAPACVVRPAAAADLPAIAALGHAAVDLGDYPDATHGDVERNLATMAAEPPSAFVAVAPDGTVAGYVAPRLNDLYVERSHRRRGYGTTLVDAAVAYVREVLRHPYLLLYVPPGDTPGRGFAEARGFTFRANLHWMERPADEPCPAPDFPADVATRAWDPQRDTIAALVELTNATFADHPTPISWTEAVIQAAHDAPDFDPRDILLVTPAGDPGQPIAFCRARLAAGAWAVRSSVGVCGTSRAAACRRSPSPSRPRTSMPCGCTRPMGFAGRSSGRSGVSTSEGRSGRRRRRVGAPAAGGSGRRRRSER